MTIPYKWHKRVKPLRPRLYLRETASAQFEMLCKCGLKARCCLSGCCCWQRFVLQVIIPLSASFKTCNKHPAISRAWVRLTWDSKRVRAWVPAAAFPINSKTAHQGGFVWHLSWEISGEEPFTFQMSQPEPDGTKECGDRRPVICKSPEDAAAPSARQPPLTAWATLSECLFHIKDDVPGSVTLMNALKTSRPAVLFTEPGEREIRRTGGDGVRTPGAPNAFVERPLSEEMRPRRLAAT